MITISNLYKAFDSKVLFNDFSLEIPDGSFVVVSGDSGCGKTTLLNMIGAIEKPDKGTITVSGINPSARRSRNKYFSETVGFLFQNFALLENKTVQKNLEIIKKSTRTDVEIEDALERVGLYGKSKTKVYKLSGGEQQRLALARLMIKKCSLILADEPTGSLDEENGRVVMEILHELNRQGMTVIIVTHNREIVAEEEFVIRL